MSENNLIKLLRISLGLIFFWFGALKIFGYNPVYEIVMASFPIFASGWGNVVLGAIETLIGLGLIFNIFRRLTHTALVIHLLGTLSVFFTGPEIMFSPRFPILTFLGEFVFKNITLALAGLVTLTHRR